MFEVYAGFYTDHEGRLQWDENIHTIAICERKQDADLICKLLNQEWAEETKDFRAFDGGLTNAQWDSLAVVVEISQGEVA